MTDNGPLDRRAPTIIWQHRCKICKMSNQYPDLFRELHSQIFEVGVSQARAMKFINDRIDREKLPIEKLNSQNMSTHFNVHISLPERVDMEVSKINQQPPPLHDVSPEVGYIVEDMVRRKVGNEVADYLNLDGLRSQLAEKLEMIDTIIEKTDEGGNKSIDQDAMDLFLRAASEIRATITDLNKIRQGRQLINMVIKSLIEKYTFTVVRQLIKKYDDLRNDMVSMGVDDNTAVKVNQQLRLDAAEIVAQTARSAVADVTKTYKLSQ